MSKRIRSNAAVNGPTETVDLRELVTRQQAKLDQQSEVLNKLLEAQANQNLSAANTRTETDDVNIPSEWPNQEQDNWKSWDWSGTAWEWGTSAWNNRTTSYTGGWNSSMDNVAVNSGSDEAMAWIPPPLPTDSVSTFLPPISDDDFQKLIGNDYSNDGYEWNNWGTNEKDNVKTDKR